MSRAHVHHCDCGTALRCTAPVIHEDSGTHCAAYGPYDPVICDECAWRDRRDDDARAWTVDEMRSALAAGLEARR